MRRARFGALALLTGLGLGACGDGGDNGGKAKVSGIPKAKGTLSAAVSRFERRLDTHDCSQVYTEVNTRDRALTSRPGSPGTRAECAGFNPAGVRSFRSTKTQEFGTAAVVDGTLLNISVAGGTRTNLRVSALWMLDTDGQWRHAIDTIAIPSPRDPRVGQVGTRPTKADAKRFAQNVANFVRAVQTRDCAGAWRALGSDSRAVVGLRNRMDAFCRSFREALQRPGSNLAVIAGDKSARPQLLGETLDYGFYAVKPKGGAFVTIVAATDPDQVNPALRRGHVEDGVLNYYRART